MWSLYEILHICKIKKKIKFCSRDQQRTFSFQANGAGVKNQITTILFKRWPTNSVSKAKSCNFHFHKNDVTWPLRASGLFAPCYWIQVELGDNLLIELMVIYELIAGFASSIFLHGTSSSSPFWITNPSTQCPQDIRKRPVTSRV